ncbi:GDSL/SGNH-like acyl-esterase family found in Pmr5 and Cas1p-domain-containing protein [Choanephora cucurbitarum]|nr:GDSL/SGNH-like acyl-esterase family found in Pmr5 and Cas1p-domain-containing protein [Choanephora cucurbitarum]
MLENSKSKNDKSKLIYAISIFGCLALWITVYNQPAGFLDLRPEVLVSDIDETRPLCTPETFNSGRWIYNPLPLEANFSATDIANVAGYHCLKKFAHRCFRRPGENELTRAKQIMDYRWQPDSCDMLEMNPERLANHFVSHPILFVGDSITQLQYESLSCLLGKHLPNRHPTGGSLNGGNSKIRVNQLAPKDRETAAIAYIRSDYLLRLDDLKVISPFEPVGVQLGSGENYPWVHALSEFDYVVINTGPHWHPNLHWGPDASEEELLDAFKRAMTNVLDYLKEHVKPHQKVWIRTTPYGHARCSRFKEPQPNPLAPSGQTGEYEWHLFDRFDQIWKGLLTSVEDDGRFGMFDIAGLSNQRGDAHSKPDVDCLHTCIPGPVDEWNRLLYHEVMKHQ